MNMPRSIDDILQNVERLPTMPKAVMEIIRCVDDDNIAIDSLVQQISSDIGLSSSILKMANTHRFSVHGGIASVHDAVMLVGFKQIRDMACMVGVMDSFPQHQYTLFDYANFWRHSMGVGICARILAKRVLDKHLGLNPDVAFISGMLHGIGQLALIAAVPDEFHIAMDYRASHDCSLFEAEQAVLGTDHAKIGAHLARKWEFPQVICDAIEKHPAPDDAPTSHMTDLIHVSKVLCHALEIGADTHTAPPLSDHAMSRLNINFFQLKPCFAQIECEYRNVAMMLG
ncbi:MAG: HDOD domain-containing protein [Gallionella sp.]|nr:MAG: HDOD domain-containing protein [Gallionella sp.]